MMVHETNCYADQVRREELKLHVHFSR